ncbi:hypothetical protein KY342_06085 [Candidatus Woesearchaeota archaeon]|nr:hypothetical protein [Candidatus Woesearchaeota archaeon]
MLKLKDYLTKEGWKQDWEETRLKKVIDDIIIDLVYSAGSSAAAGLGNAVKESCQGESFTDGFWQGSTNHLALALIANIVHPFANSYFRKTKHYRLNVNLFLGSVFSVMISLHYFLGTYNPIEAMIPPGLAVTAITNIYVSKTQNGGK